MNIHNRLKKLEQSILSGNPKQKRKTDECICPKRKIYISFTDITKEEAAERYPDNLEHCQTCGGRNTVVYLETEDLETLNDAAEQPR